MRFSETKLFAAYGKVRQTETPGRTILELVLAQQEEHATIDLQVTEGDSSILTVDLRLKYIGV